MGLKKINAVLSLLTIPALFVHVGYTVYAYLTFYYNPGLKLWTAVPFMVLACLHGVCGMAAVFLQSDGTRLNLYAKANRRTVVQRLSAALIFPLLCLHLRTYDLLKSSSEVGQWPLFALVMIAQPLFYVAVFAHVAPSVSRAMITLGWLSSRDRQKAVDRIVFIVCAVVLIVALYAVVKGELAMFAH